MVQLLKRLSKYRATCDPEAVFVNDQLLRRTCLLLHHDPETEGATRETMQEAADRERGDRSRRRRQRTQDTDTEPDDRVFGRGKELDQQELAEVLPTSYSGEGEPSGLPYLLLQEDALQHQGWPTYAVLGAGESRAVAITRALGLPVGGDVDPSRTECTVHLRKFMRATAAVGDVLSCAQQTTQGVKDNKWCLLAYKVQVNPPGGTSYDRTDYYVGQFQYLLRAWLETPDGLEIVASCEQPAETLYLGVADLYHCDLPQTPGARPPDDVLRRPPEFFRVREGQRGRSPFAGRWVVDLDSLPCQLVPTTQIGGSRFFGTANKASGRTVHV